MIWYAFSDGVLVAERRGIVVDVVGVVAAWSNTFQRISPLIEYLYCGVIWVINKGI